MKRILLLAWALCVSMHVYTQEAGVSGAAALSNPYGQWRLSLGLGYGYRPAKLSSSVPGEFASYARKLKSGLALDGNISYFFKERWGLGLQTNRFSTSNRLSDASYTDGAGIVTDYGAMEDNISITFVGPNAVNRRVYSNGNMLSVGISLGYLGYLNRFELNASRHRMTGASLGYVAHVGYDLCISEHFSVGAKLSALTGFLSRLNVDGFPVDLEGDNRESLNRIDIGIGVRFH